jgi:hypothetical protein
MRLVLAPLLTLFAATVNVTVPAAGASDCPAPAQLGEALNALMPGVVPTAAPTGATGLRLSVVTLPAGDLRVELTDDHGEIVLHRVLPAPPRGREADCPALAQTVALIIERYLHEVGYEAPPLPPPAPKPAPPPPAEPAAPPPTVVATPPAPPAAGRAPASFRVGLAASARRGDSGDFDGDGDLVLGFESGGDGALLGVRLSAGLALPADARWTDGAGPRATDQTATLRRVPFRLGLYARVPIGPGQLEPGLGGGVDWLLISTTGPGTAGGRHVAPFGDAAVGYQVLTWRPLYLRVLSRIALAVPYDFRTLAGTRVWGTPRIYGEAGVELGFAFP